MEEHGSSKPLVGGSSPSGGTKLQLRVCSIVDNVPDCQSGDWSSILPHPANPLLIY